MIRNYNIEDINQIVALEEELLHTTLGYDYFVNNYNNEMFKCYVAIKDDKVVGYLSIMFDGFVGEILNFCVDKNYQNLKIGSNLLSHAHQNILANSFILEVREDNLKAIAVYTKFNYKKIHIRKNYYSDGMNAYVLERVNGKD